MRWSRSARGAPAVRPVTGSVVLTYHVLRAARRHCMKSVDLCVHTCHRDCEAAKACTAVDKPTRRDIHCNENTWVPGRTLVGVCT